MSESNSYDKVPYLGRVHPTTAPLHLAFVSLFFGGPAPAMEEYRVMDLGCGDGANLIPMAFYNPNCDFVGIDNSHGQVDAAKQKADSLDLKNIRFEQRDVRELNPQDYEHFDYIIAHGLFSWIPDDARRAVLSFCKTNLKENGLAYICYNAMPGWGIRGTIRDILLNSQRVKDAPVEQQAKAAQAVIEELYEDLPSRDYAFGDLMAREFEYLLAATPFYVQHEYLAEHNKAFWLSEFVNMAAEFNLDYVADAQFGKPEGRLPQGVTEALSARSLTPVEQEERSDLLCQRTLRTSILCRRDAKRSSVSRQQLLSDVYLASDLSAMSDPFNLENGVVETFKGRSAVEITLEESITKAAVLCLSSAWPTGIKFESLLAQAEQMLLKVGFLLPDNREKTLTDEITELLTLGELEWRLKEPTAAATANPNVHLLARQESAQSNMVTTPHHLSLPLEPEILEVVRQGANYSEQDNLFDLATPHIVGMLVKWGLVR